jgi:hypothetical protein
VVAGPNERRGAPRAQYVVMRCKNERLADVLKCVRH